MVTEPKKYVTLNVVLFKNPASQLSPKTMNHETFHQKQHHHHLSSSGWTAHIIVFFITAAKLSPSMNLSKILNWQSYKKMSEKEDAGNAE